MPAAGIYDNKLYGADGAVLADYTPNPRGQGGFGDARDLGPNAAAMGTFYDPTKKQGDVTGQYYDYLNPSLRVNQGGTQIANGSGVADPTWSVTGSQYGSPQSSTGGSPGGANNAPTQTAASQAYSQQGQQYSAYPQQGGSYAQTYSQAPSGGYGSATTMPQAGYPGTSGYSPATPGAPGQLQNNTWWGDPAQASLENAFSQYGQNLLNPTNTQQLNASNPYSMPLQGEMLGRNATSLYGNTTNTQSNLGSILGNVNAPSELAQNSGALSGIYGGADNAQGYLSQMGSQLAGPGALEQFAASSLNGSNPYYERLGQQGRAAIDQGVAARGAYGAGGALAALGNYQSGLDAQNFQQQAQLQGSAQAAQMQRLGLGGSLSQAADSSALNQGNALAGLYQNMFGDRMQGQQLGLQANQAADASNIARLAGLTSMVGQGDATTLQRLAGQTGLANNADTTGLNYLNSYFNQAGNAQQAGGQRVNSQLDRALQEAIAQAGFYGGFYGQGGQQSVEAGTGSANAGANAAQLKGQGQNSGYQNLLTAISLGVL